MVPNPARGGIATQISNYTHEHLFPNPDEGKYAIDGDFSNFIPTGGRCAITELNAGAWWQVDLLATYEISKVAILTRYLAGKILFHIYRNY